MKMFFHILLIIFFYSTAFAQSEKDFPQIDKSDFPQIDKSDFPDSKITRTSYFNGNALWGLIDGGADVYLEYGFNKLLLQEIEWRGYKFRVEIYKMNDVWAAFGIFSISRFKCTKKDTLTKYICITPFQVQSALGKFYISIANDKGTWEAQNLTIDLFSKILAKTDNFTLTLPVIFQKAIFEQYKDQLKYFRGKLGLQNGFPIWSELFEGFSDYEIYLLQLEREEGYVYITQIQFKSENDLQKFVSANQSKLQNRIIKTFNATSPGQIIFVETNLGEKELDEIIN